MEVYGVIRGGKSNVNIGPVQFEANVSDSQHPKFVLVKRELYSCLPGFEDNSFKFWNAQGLAEDMHNKRIEVHLLNQNLSNNGCKNIESLNLALLLSPLSKCDKLSFPYERVCFTGDVTLDGVYEPRVIEAGNVDEKYALLLKSDEFKKGNSVFVYVSEPKQQIKSDNALKTIRIDPGTSVVDIIRRLSDEFKTDYYGKFIVRQKLEDIMAGTDRKIHFEYFFRRASVEKKFIQNSQELFFFNLNQQLIEDNKTFELSISMPAAILDEDYAGNNAVFAPKPKWYEKIEKESPEQAPMLNDNLKFLRGLIVNEKESLDRLFFLYNKKKYRRLAIQIIENRTTPDLAGSNLENALYIWWHDTENSKREYLIIDDGKNLWFCDLTEKESLKWQKDKIRYYREKLDNIKKPFNDDCLIPTTKNEEPLIVLVGPPGIGKTKTAGRIKDKLSKKHVLISDDFIYHHLFNDSGNGFAPYSTLEFQEAKDSFAFSERKKQRDAFIQIWGLAEEIVLKMAIAQGEVVDMDGKALLFPNIQKLIKKGSIICILLIPQLTSAEKEHYSSQEEIKNAEFEEYFKIYKERGKELLDGKGRKNIFQLMQEAICKKYDPKNNKITEKTEKTEKCGTCLWHKPNGCPHRNSEDDMWNNFHDKLKAEIWVRYDIYHRVQDETVDVRYGMTTDEIIDQIEIKIEEFKKELAKANQQD